MSEAFLGSIEAIQGAFSLPDPTPQLLELIHAHPETPTIGDIVIICYELVLQFPSQVNKLAGILVNLKSTTFTIGACGRSKTNAGIDRLGPRPGARWIARQRTRLRAE